MIFNFRYAKPWIYTVVQGALQEEDDRPNDYYEFDEADFTRHANIRFFHPMHDGLHASGEETEDNGYNH